MDALFYLGVTLFLLGVGALAQYLVFRGQIKQLENDFQKKINVERNEIASLEKERRWLEGLVK